MAISNHRDREAIMVDSSLPEGGPSVRAPVGIFLGWWCSVRGRCPRGLIVARQAGGDVVESITLLLRLFVRNWRQRPGRGRAGAGREAGVGEHFDSVCAGCFRKDDVMSSDLVLVSWWWCVLGRSAEAQRVSSRVMSE